MDGIVFTEDDARLLFGGSVEEPKSFMYFDDQSGAVKSVSHHPNDEMSNYPFVMVSSALVSDLISGKRQLTDWSVIYQGDEPVAICGDIDRITIRDSRSSFTTISNEPSQAPVVIAIVVPKSDSVGEILVEQQDGMEITTDIEYNLSFTITKRGNPDAILAEVSVSAIELFQTGRVEVDFVQKLSCDIDITTKPLTSVGYRVQRFPNSDRPISLPAGRIDDFQTVSLRDDVDPALVVEIHTDSLLIYLREGGGQHYDRSISTLMFSLSQPGNRDALYWRGRVPISDLLAGPVRFNIPPIEGEFEIVTNRYFLKTVARDERAVAVIEAIEPTPHGLMELLPRQTADAGMAVVIDNERASVTVSIVGDGGIEYCEDGMLSITEPNEPEVVRWTAVLKADEIKEGKLFWVGSVVEGDYSVYATPMFRHQYLWEEVEEVIMDETDDRFITLLPVPTSRLPKNCFVLWVNKSRDRLFGQLLGNGGVSVDQDRIEISFLHNGDVISTIWFDNEQLKNGQTYGLPLPQYDELTDSKFELMVETVYKDTYFVEK